MGNGGTQGWVTEPIVNNGTLVFNRDDAQTFSAAISGSGSVAQSGTSTLTLAGVNGYTGATYLNGGTLSIASPANIGGLGNSSNLVFNSGVLEYTGVSGASSQGVTVNAGGGTVRIDNPGQALTLNGAVSGVGGLTVAGSGTLAVLGSFGLGSTTQVTGGTLAVLGNVNTYLNSPIVIGAGAVMQSGATFNLDVDQNGSVGSTNVSGAGTLQLVATASSRSAPDIYFGPDHVGNDYWGAAIRVATLDLGSAQALHRRQHRPQLGRRIL